jgi:ubiquinone/menaquinone biosynthesis C-methylase UbiE
VIDRELNYGRHLVKSFSKNAIFENKNSTKNPVILDIGAGSGTDLDLVRQVLPSAEFHALESYPANVKSLQEKGVRVSALNLEQDLFPFKTESVDLIIANQILEHTKEIFWIFHEVSRVLKVGGSFVIGVPNLASFHNRLLLLMGRQPTSCQTASAHIRGFTKHDLLRFFKKCFPEGYALKDFGGSNFYPFPGSIAKPFAQLWGNGSVGIFMRFEKLKPYNNSFVEYPVNERLETNYFLG